MRGEAMQIVVDELATVDLARAYQLDDVLLVRVFGTKPTACHVVTLEQSLLTVEPPSFIARLSTDPRVRCIPAPAPFEEQRAFRIGILRPQIIVQHEGEDLTVEVEDLTPLLDGGGARLEDPAGGFLSHLGYGRGEAVGYSPNYDLGEA